MTTTYSNGFERRNLWVAAAAVALLGTLLHAADQATATRAGPLPILVTAPLFATLCYLWVRPVSTRRLLGLLTWGLVSTGLGVLGVYLVAVSYQLPRAMTGTEMVLFDLGMFGWFVLVLAVVYVAAANRTGRGVALALLSAPLLQASFSLVPVALVELGLFA